MVMGVSAALILAAQAGAVNVYVLSSGSTAIDDAVSLALTSRGHTVTVGVQWVNFDGTQSLSGFQTVYFQANENWSLGDMPQAGQMALRDWVSGGGRLVTAEWVIWLAATARLQVLAATLPAVIANNYSSPSAVTYQVATPNPVINAGLPTSFTFPVDNYGGTETFTTARAGATTYYTTDSSPGAMGLVGWASGGGSVFCFSTTVGPTQAADTNFGRLLANVVGATASGGCYANCDSSTISPILNVNDFICFQGRYAAGDSYANCDASTIQPVLNVNDFICFQGRFAAGCS